MVNSIVLCPSTDNHSGAYNLGLKLQIRQLMQEYLMSWHNKDPRQMLKSQIILSSHLELLLLMPKNRKLFVDPT